MPWVYICDVAELEDEDAIGFTIGDRSYAICRTEAGETYCIDGLCPEDGAHLAGGLVEGRFIECPAHEGRFDLATLPGYPLREADGRIEADLP